MIDIECSKLDDYTLKKNIIKAYVERDERIYSQNGVNTLLFALQKVRAYDLDYEINHDIILKLVDQREYYLFYSLFSVGDLCVLGY